MNSRAVLDTDFGALRLQWEYSWPNISLTCSHYFLIYFTVGIIMKVMTIGFMILKIVQLFKLVIFCVLCVLKASILFFFSSSWAMRQVTGWETGEDDMQDSSWSTAVRTQSLHTGCTLYHLSYSGTQSIVFCFVLWKSVAPSNKLRDNYHPTLQFLSV